MNLIFKRVTLQNFGSFSNTHVFELNRAPGLYFISGINKSEPALTSNGVGKSTLINALYWSLTGRTLRTQRPGSSIESWYSSSTVSSSVEVQVNNIDYKITRTRKPNSLTLNDQVVEQQVIDDLLKLTDEALKRTILVGQFVPLFLDLKAEQQSNLFSEALNLDLWLTASEKAALEHKVIEGQIAKLQVSNATLLGRLSQLKEQYTLECDREKTFDASKAIKLNDLRQTLISATHAMQAADAAFKRATRPQNVLAVPSTSKSAPLATRALERDLTRSESDVIAKLRTWQREAELTQVNLARYQSTKNFCPECNQVVEPKHIKLKVKELTQHYNDLIKRIDQAEQQRTKIVKYLADARQSLEEQEQAQAAYTEQNDLYVDLRRKLDTASVTVMHLRKELEKAKHMTNPYTDSCEQLAATYFDIEKQIKAISAEIDEANEQSSIYKYWTAAYKEIRLNLIDDTLQELEIAANRHIQSLGLNDWQIEFKTERENKSGTISHSFSTVIYPNGQTKPISFESYSGGESQRLQLAVTAALSEILLDYAGISTNIEVYDEASKHLSKEGITDLLECLKERATDLNRCIYFIDHNSIESGYFDKVIMIEKDRNGSRILE